MLFYGDFDYYKFAHHIDSIFGNSYTVTSQQTENVAVMACDRAYDPEVYASVGQSAYAFATIHPYAGEDGVLCAPETGFTITNATNPAMSSCEWQTSGSGEFSNSLSLTPTYFPSEADFDAGEVTLTLRVNNNGVWKSDAMQLKLYKELRVFAGEDYYSGLNRPVEVNQAQAENYDSIRWTSFGDGVFEDATVLHTLYYPGEGERQQRYVELVLKAWSHCGIAEDIVRFDLYEEFSLEGTVWSSGSQKDNVQVVAAGVYDGNPFFSGFYRTVSDEDGRFRFESLLPDTYILYAFPDTVDLVAGGAYYLGDYQWNESNMIVVDGDVYDVDIVLPSLQQGVAMGTGRISGVFDYPDEPFRASDFYCEPWLREGDGKRYCEGGLSNVGVLLLNANKQRLLGFALTDAKGRFRFNSLPFGTYHVLSDLPRYGRGMCEQIVLSPEQPDVANLHLFVDRNGRVAMRQDVVSTDRRVLVFPNPVEKDLVVNGLLCSEEYLVTVSNSMGSVVLPPQILKSNLLGEVEFSVQGLSRGLYFVTVSGKSETWMIKFVKY